MAINHQTEFATELRRLRERSGKSKYRLAQYSGLDEGYVGRLESGARHRPTRDVVIKIGFALVADSDRVSMEDVYGLLIATGYVPLLGRGESIPLD